MGLFDFLLPKDKRTARALEKNVARALNKWAQSGDRLRALEALAEDGSEEALYGLLRRFSFKYDKSIEDEQEKEWVCEVLVSKGAAALPAVKRYLRSADSIAWPLRVLDQIIESKDEELAVIEQVLERHPPGYERDPTKKVQLMNHLGSLKTARAAGLAAPYLEDMDEGVRFAAAETLLRSKDEAIARAPLLTRFIAAEEESLRLRLRIADGFADLGWVAGEHREAAAARLPEGFSLNKEGRFTKKGAKA